MADRTLESLAAPDFCLPPDLETPSLVVDVTRLDANIRRMAALAREAGVDLWPHAKTHKCVPIGRRQLAAGAAGLTVATLDEAEAFAEAGFPDVFIAYPVWAGAGRAARIREVHERTRLRVGVDTTAGADALAAATQGSGRPLGVLVEVDCGGHRTGVPPAGVAALAIHCLRRGLDVLGAFTHPGHAYAGLSAVAGASADERAALAAAGAVLERLLDRPPVLSGGSTPTAADGLAAPLTEVRPGTYIFGDRQQTYLSALPPRDVALVVAARVVSVRRPGEAVLDAGSKALSSDRPDWLTGHGFLPGAPEAGIVALTEEHAVVRGLRQPLAVGDLVAVVPNHVCSAVNLGTELLVVTDGAVVDAWPVSPRSARRDSAPRP